MRKIWSVVRSFFIVKIKTVVEIIMRDNTRKGDFLELF